MSEYNKAEVLWRIFETITDQNRPYLQKLIEDPNVSGLDLGYKVFERLGNPEQSASREAHQLAIRLHVRQKNLLQCTLKEGVHELAPVEESNSLHSFKQQVDLEESQRNYYAEFLKLVLKDMRLQDRLDEDVALVFSRETDIIQMQPRNRSGASAKPPVNQATGILQPGLSVGHKNRRAGTLGAVVYDNDQGYPLLLSCWHVLTMPDALPNSRILQPGPSDGGLPESDWIGSFEPRGAFPNAVGDAAVAKIIDSSINGRVVKRGQFGTNDGTGKPIVVEKTAQITYRDLGERLEKSGKATGVTQGMIDGVGIYFADYGMGERLAVHGFKIVPLDEDHQEISAPGDSGALWYRTKDHVGVGLHFEGEKNLAFDAEQALACHLEPVLKALHVRLVPDS